MKKVAQVVTLADVNTNRCMPCYHHCTSFCCNTSIINAGTKRKLVGALTPLVITVVLVRSSALLHTPARPQSAIPSLLYPCIMPKKVAILQVLLVCDRLWRVLATLGLP